MDVQMPILGQLRVSNLILFTLIDSGATHSFMAKRLGDKLEGKRRKFTSPFITITPAEDVYKSMSLFKNIPIKIGEFILYANLIEIEMYNFDVVLGMDWLTTHFSMIDCRRKYVRFSPSNAQSLEFQGTPQDRTISTISVL